ncbi:MAG: FAD-dependent monooxygenase [Betaproteobacteria bacterium]|nr:FAD-dependent monooxygenase [Betaproteobacteria bacterium]
MTEQADVVIIGGGPVGAALALALADTGMSLKLLEARNMPAGDRRPLALSYGSRLILESLGAWGGLHAPTPIEAIHVSQSGGFGRVMLTAREVQLPALGYVVDYADLHAALIDALAGALRPTGGARVLGVSPREGAAVVSFEAGGAQHALGARLVAVADGGALPGIAPSRMSDYGQSAVVAMVTSELPHRHMAFERFTPEGPLALLPSGEHIAVVWTTAPKRAADLCALDERAFCAQLVRGFGARLGAFRSASARASVPLALRVANRDALPATVLLGNAAQTLHPVAGQGFNLGLRDAWELADEIRRWGPNAIGSRPMLDAYRRRRRLDRGGGIGFTHSLVRLFSNDIAPLRAARGIGLTLLGCVPPARDYVARRMIFGSRA